MLVSAERRQIILYLHNMKETSPRPPLMHDDSMIALQFASHLFATDATGLSGLFSSPLFETK